MKPGHTRHWLRPRARIPSILDIEVVRVIGVQDKEVSIMRFQLPTCFFLRVAAAFAQSDRGTITGTVSDPAKALVPDAAVVAVDSDTGAQYDTVTTGSGNFTLPSLPAGVYNLSVSAAGFSTYVQQGIRVQVVQTARVDV